MLLSTVAGLMLMVPGAMTERTFTFINNCQQTIWVGGQGNPLPPEHTGWEMAPGSSKAIPIADNFNAGRFWPRTGCKLDQEGNLRCTTGDCWTPAAGKTMQCNGIGGQPPVTLAEMTLGALDYYDLSNVDGYNIGMSIEAVDSAKKDDVYYCGRASCTMDMSKCPPELMMDDGAGGKVCASICAAIHNEKQRQAHPKLQAIYDNPDQKSNVCCSCDCGPNCGCTDPRSTHCCSPFGPKYPEKQVCRVENWPKPDSPYPSYEKVFKDQCPDAYSWQFDDLSSTFQCDTKPNYKIVFCPSGPSSGLGSKDKSIVPPRDILPGATNTESSLNQQAITSPSPSPSLGGVGAARPSEQQTVAPPSPGGQ